LWCQKIKSCAKGKDETIAKIYTQVDENVVALPPPFFSATVQGRTEDKKKN
jgi:hypothetical protein